MNIEKIERTVVERVLSVSPDIASAEVIYASPIELPEKVKAEAYTGLVIIGKGKIVPGASAKIANFPSFKASVVNDLRHGRVWPSDVSTCPPI